MKKIVSIILCFLFILSLTACNKNDKKDVIDFNKIDNSTSESSSGDSEKSSATDKSSSDNDTSASVSVKSDTDSSNKNQSDDISKFIESNEVLSDIAEKAKAMKKVESFSFKLNVATQDLTEDEQDKDEHKAEGALKYNADKGTVTLKMKYDGEDVVVFSSKDSTLIATRENSDDEWEISSGSDEDGGSDDGELNKIIDIITKVRTFGESGNLNSTDLINKLLSYLGLSTMSNKENATRVAQDIIDTFTSKENRQTLLGFYEAENTDGTTYSIEPDLLGCMDELTVLLKPLFQDEDSYGAFTALMSIQQLSMSGASLKASLKLDKNNYINAAKLNFSSTSYLMTAQLNISDINSAKVNIDTDLQKIIDKKN